MFSFFVSLSSVEYLLSLYMPLGLFVPTSNLDPEKAFAILTLYSDTCIAVFADNPRRFSRQLHDPSWAALHQVASSTSAFYLSAPHPGASRLEATFSGYTSIFSSR